MSATAQPDTKLETQSCTRCGGSGHYSYCQSHGTTCFKCGGNKIIWTKRGALASSFLTALCSKRADQIVVGEKVKTDFGCPISGQVRGFGTVTESYMSTLSGGTANGVQIFHYVVTVTHPKHGGISHHGSPSTVYRVAQNAADKAAKFQLALAFQAKLTKSGKIAKNAVLTEAEFAFAGSIFSNLRKTV